MSLPRNETRMLERLCSNTFALNVEQIMQGFFGVYSLHMLNLVGFGFTDLDDSRLPVRSLLG